MRASTALASLVLLASLAGRAADPPPPPGIPAQNEGTVTVLGGARLIPQGGFLDDQEAAGYRPWKTLVEPAGLLQLGYAPEPDFNIGLTLGYALNNIHLSAGLLAVRSFTILVGADAPFLRRPWGTFYGGGGIGYSLNTLSQSGNNVESNSTAAYVCLGARFPLTERFALVIEDRYTLSYASLPGPSGPLVYAGTAGSLNVGGNTFSIGLMFHYTDSEESKRPRHP